MRTSIGIRCCVVAPINLDMALAAREVHIAAGDDHAVAVEKNIVVTWILNWEWLPRWKMSLLLWIWGMEMLE